MTYVENIFVLLASPVLACLLVVRGRPRSAVAAISSGMFACLLSSYVNSSIARWIGTNALQTSIEVAPVVEEVMKLLPLLYYLLVLEPSPDATDHFAVFVVVGFVTMENACYLAEYGTSSPMLLALRGLSTSIMHLSCGVVVGFALSHIWAHPWFKAAGTFGLLSLTIVYHGIFNLLVAWDGPARVCALLLPPAVLAAVLFVRRAADRLQLD